MSFVGRSDSRMERNDLHQRTKPRFRRMAFLVLGWLFFGIGLVGAFLPVLPTTPFMILALWAFARSSERFHTWLYTHPVFGPPLQRWNTHRVIPASSKLLSVGAMAVSLAYLVWLSEAPPVAVLSAAAIMGIGAAYILTRPSRIPAAEGVVTKG